MLKVSVLISVYNGEKYIREAVDSVLNQTLGDLEVVVVNDGSTDGTDGVMRTYTDQRVKYLDRHHEGRVPALNAGLEVCTGEYISILDADDVYESDKLERQLGYMQERGLALCGSWTRIIDEDGHAIGEMKYPPLEENNIRRYALMHNPFIHSTVVVRADTLRRVGGYKPFRYGVEDYELWTRLIYKHKVGNIPEMLVRYRVHSAQATKRVNMQMRTNALRVRALALARCVSSLLG